MAYTRNPPWKDYPDTSTLVTAAKLENIEQGILSAASTADTALSRTGGDFASQTTKISQGATAYAWQTGKLVVDLSLYAANANVTVSPSMGILEFVSDGSHNVTFDLAVDANAVVGRSLILHVPTNNSYVKWNANVIVESWPTDWLQELWGTIVFDNDNKWHVIASPGAIVKSNNVDLYGSLHAATGNYNFAGGQYSLGQLTTGNYNVGVGYDTLYSLTTGSGNVGVGRDAGPDYTTTGAVSNTVAIGYAADVYIDSTVAIGAFSTVATGHTNSVALGASVTTNNANQVAVGARDVEIQDATKGVVLKSPNGTRYRITVTDAGALTVTAA